MGSRPAVGGYELATLMSKGRSVDRLITASREVRIGMSIHRPQIIGPTFFLLFLGIS